MKTMITKKEESWRGLFKNFVEKLEENPYKLGIVFTLALLFFIGCISAISHFICSHFIMPYLLMEKNKEIREIVSRFLS